MTTEHNLPGVYTSTKKDGSTYYRSSLTYLGKHISLGSYPTMKKAHEAYKEGLAILSTPSFTLESFHNDYALSFEKWVSLVNLRDNGIYFPNPIYIRKKYFEYHLSEDFIFKFDMDDLFYYSSHKIMRRKGHFFVADYGMQYNIRSRYGIKNYGVEGRDYQFINGDPTDFRYENIEILNIYHGVSSIEKKKKIFYQARIHIKGNYLVGFYHTPEEAAVAYNRAIDILRKKGVQKNYTPNYIESLSPKEYANIYSSISISDKIMNYLAE